MGDFCSVSHTDGLFIKQIKKRIQSLLLICLYGACWNVYLEVKMATNYLDLILLLCYTFSGNIIKYLVVGSTYRVKGVYINEKVFICFNGYMFDVFSLRLRIFKGCS